MALRSRNRRCAVQRQRLRRDCLWTAHLLVRTVVPGLSSRMLPPPIRIIGIDPGLRTTGWGIIEAQGSRLSFIACGCVRSDDKLSTAARLRQLHEGLSEIIAAHAPHESAGEETYASRDTQS